MGEESVVKDEMNLETQRVPLMALERPEWTSSWVCNDGTCWWSSGWRTGEELLVKDEINLETRVALMGLEGPKSSWVCNDGASWWSWSTVDELLLTVKDEIVCLMTLEEPSWTWVRDIASLYSELHSWNRDCTLTKWTPSQPIRKKKEKSMRNTYLENISVSKYLTAIISFINFSSLMSEVDVI